VDSFVTTIESMKEYLTTKKTPGTINNKELNPIIIPAMKFAKIRGIHFLRPTIIASL